MTATVVPNDPEAREPRQSPRTQRFALGIALAVILLGVAGIAVVSRAGSSRLPLLPVGASAGAARDSAASMMMPVRPVEYRLSASVSAPADRARAYEFAPPDASGVDKLRDALGLKGAVKSEPGAWTVTDGSRVLRVQSDPAMSWSFGEEMNRCGATMPVTSDGHPEDACGNTGSGVITPDGVVSSGPAESSPASPPTAEPCPMPPCPQGSACIQSCAKPMDPGPPPRPADLPAQAEAESIGRAFLTRTGIGDATVEVMDGYTVWSVIAHPTFQGLSTTGYEQSVQVGSKGTILSAQGMLGRPTALGEYPLVDLPKAVERLKTGFGGRGGGGPMPMGAAESGVANDSGPAMTMIAPVPPDGALPPDTPPPPDASPPVDTTPMVVTITSVRLALELVPSYVPNAPSAHLIPAYVFGTDDGGTVSVLAVADEYLDTAGYAPYPGGSTEPGVPPEGKPTQIDPGPPTQVEPQPAPAPAPAAKP